jgi:energy-coupling factor transporter ATP-binding protein EcfA2
MTYASQTPEFDAQLSRSFGGDSETIAFFQRLCGTFLIGVPLPKPTVIVFAGPSASGKSTLISLLESIFGTHPYGYSARIDSFLLSYSVRPGAFREIRNARVVFSNIQGLRGPLRSQPILALLNEAPGAKLVVESNDVPKLDNPAAVEMIVVPFQHDAMYEISAGSKASRRALYTTK